MSSGDDVIFESTKLNNILECNINIKIVVGKMVSMVHRTQLIHVKTMRLVKLCVDNL